MSKQFPYKPPHDAREWTCPICLCDSLWCGCQGMTPERRESFARQAEIAGLPDVADAVRRYLSLEPISERDIQRTRELAERLGWEREA